MYCHYAYLAERLTKVVREKGVQNGIDAGVCVGNHMGYYPNDDR